MKSLNLNYQLSLLITFSALYLTNPVLAQHNLFGFKKSNSIPVNHNGSQLNFPWAGGLNSAQVNTIDLDRDGNQDLVLFDKEGKNFLTFLAVGSGSSAHYEYAPQYESFFPPTNNLNNWLLIRDYDCDGKKDLFLGYNSYIKVWKNTSTSSHLHFTAVNNGAPLESVYSQGKLGLFVNSANLPGIADINNDGALDILTYANFSIEMEYHQGQTPCGLDMKLAEICWGHFTETGTAPGATLNACIPHKKNTMDGSSTILPIDLNNDQVFDLILGNNTFPSLAALYNGGDADSAHMVSQTTTYPTNNPIDVPSAPAAFYEDIDFDGLKDLIVSPSLESGFSIDKASVFLYKNIGNSSTPNFSFVKEDFIQEDMIDLGERSVPRFADLNNDGLLDLVVSNGLYHLKDLSIGHNYYYYQNTGTANQPSFTLIDTNFMDITSHGISIGSIPTFGDLDGDGDLDAIVGDIYGNIHYFTNSSATNPSFSLASSNFQGINVGNNAAPFLFDLDSNGTQDLFIGNLSGGVYYYNNTSSSSPNFSLQSARFGGFKVPPSGSGCSIPYLFKHKGAVNLFVGSSNSGIFQFDSISEVMNKPNVLQPTVGTGTIVSSNTNETPFGIKHKNGRNQILIRASEMRSAGLVYGYINSISFKVTTSSNNSFDELYVRLKNTTDTTLDAFQSGLTQVLSDSPGFSQGWNSLQFTTPFLWDGVSNLAIEICFSGQPKSLDIHVEMTDVGFNANAWGEYVDPSYSANGCAQPYLASSTHRPNMRISLTPAFANTENYASGLYTAPALADLNNDGFADMITGRMNGGLNYFEGKIYDVGLDEAVSPRNIKSLRVYPNPGTGKFFVETPNLGKASVLVYNINGKAICQKSVDASTTEVSLDDQAPGIYIFILQSDNTIQTAKVIKQ